MVDFGQSDTITLARKSEIASKPVSSRFRAGFGPASIMDFGLNSAPPEPLAGLRDPTSKGRGGEGGGGVRWGGEGKGGKGRGGKGRRGGEKGRGRSSPPNVSDALTPLSK